MEQILPDDVTRQFSSIFKRLVLTVSRKVLDDYVLDVENDTMKLLHFLISYFKRRVSNESGSAWNIIRKVRNGIEHNKIFNTWICLDLDDALKHVRKFLSESCPDEKLEKELSNLHRRVSSISDRLRPKVVNTGDLSEKGDLVFEGTLDEVKKIHGYDFLRKYPNFVLTDGNHAGHNAKFRGWSGTNVRVDISEVGTRAVSIHRSIKVYDV